MRYPRRLPLLLAWLTVLNVSAAAANGQQQAGATNAAEAGGAIAPTDTLAAAPEVATLSADLDRIIDRAEPSARWSVLVYSLDQGDTLYARGADEPLAPASNMKLFTTAAALEYLDPSYRYKTYLIADGPVRSGVLDGDLVIYGTGDPTISDRFYGSKIAVWEAFADALQRAGIREVRGDIVGDGSYFGATETGIGWRENYMEAWYAAPTDALSFNENIVTLRIRPADEVGWRPEVEFVPGGRGIAVVNQAMTAARSGSRLRVERAAYDGPIVIRGDIRPGHAGIWRAVPVADPARYAAVVFREVLENREVRVRGGVRSVHDAAESVLGDRAVFAPAFDDERPVQVLAVHRSPPLHQILDVVNRESHNMYAEMVLRTVGRAAVGDGSIRGGARAVERFLERRAGVDSMAFRMFDGSGLSALNRASARALGALLAAMPQAPEWPTYWSTLPEAGASDGLRRMYRTDAAGNLRAKTGTIRGVSALSGYVRAANGERLAFSIISNDVNSTWRAKRVEDAIGARLASFDRPAASGLTTAWTTAAAPGAAAPTSADPGAGPEYHRVRAGDTLDGIARRYGLPLDSLNRLNPGVDPRRLLPGEPIRVR